MRSQWGEMWPLAYLIGAVEQFSTSLCPWNQAEKPDCSSIPGHFIQAQPGSSVPFQSSTNDTWRHPQHDGGPEGSNTNVNIVSHRLVISGSSLTKTAIRNTSDTQAWNETPLRARSRHRQALPECIYIYVTVSSSHRWWEDAFQAGDLLASHWVYSKNDGVSAMK